MSPESGLPDRPYPLSIAGSSTFRDCPATICGLRFGGMDLGELTEEQRRFLVSHKISPNSVFDATGMSLDAMQTLMKAEEKFFAFGTSPCAKAGHTLRDRANHCIQCDPKNITFMLRAVSSGYLYVSASEKLRMLKVGFSSDPEARQRTIKGFAYGGASDWVKIAHMYLKNAGKAELEVHSKLAPYLAPQTYRANGRDTTCREIFTCGYGKVLSAILETVGKERYGDIVAVKDVAMRYNFESRTKA